MKKLNVSNISYSKLVINITELLKLYDNKIFPKFIHDYIPNIGISLSDIDYYYEPMYNYIILSCLSDILTNKYKTKLSTSIERNPIFELIYKDFGWEFYYYIENNLICDDIFLDSLFGISKTFNNTDIIKAMVCGESLFIAKRRSLS